MLIGNSSNVAYQHNTLGLTKVSIVTLGALNLKLLSY